MSLQAARTERERAKSLLREGHDPVQARRTERVANVASGDDIFEKTAREWLKHESSGWSVKHLNGTTRSLERDVTAVIKSIMAGGGRKGGRSRHQTAVKVLQHISKIFSYAQANDQRDDNPATPVQIILPKADHVIGRPALTGGGGNSARRPTRRSPKPAFVARDPRLVEWLAVTGMGDRPHIIKLAIQKSRSRRGGAGAIAGEAQPRRSASRSGL